jgi:hypothetical protein
LIVARKLMRKQSRRRARFGSRELLSLQVMIGVLQQAADRWLRDFSVDRFALGSTPLSRPSRLTHPSVNPSSVVASFRHPLLRSARSLLPQSTSVAFLDIQTKGDFLLSVTACNWFDGCP